MKAFRFGEIPTYRYVYYYHKNLTRRYPILNVLNSGSSQERYLSLVEKDFSNLYKEGEKVEEEFDMEIVGPKPLTLVQMKSVFWLLEFGWGASILCFLITTFYNKLLLLLLTVTTFTRLLKLHIC